MTGEERIRQILVEMDGMGGLWDRPICIGRYLDVAAFPDASDGAVVVRGKVHLAAAGAFCPRDTEFIDGPQGYWWNDQTLTPHSSKHVHVIMRISSSGTRSLEVQEVPTPPPFTAPIDD